MWLFIPIGLGLIQRPARSLRSRSVDCFPFDRARPRNENRRASGRQPGDMSIRRITRSSAGTFPGGENIPWAQAVQENGTFEQVEELRKLCQDKGVTQDKQVIPFCQTGERSSHVWFVLKNTASVTRTCGTAPFARRNETRVVKAASVSSAVAQTCDSRPTAGP